MADDIVFTIRARDEISKALDRVNAELAELIKTSGGADKRIEGLEASARRLKRSLASMEHETTDVRQAMAKLKTENSQVGTNFRRVSAAVDDSSRSMTSNAAAINAAERQMEQMNDVTRRYSHRVQTATARTSSFRRAQGRLATNIRNTRTIMYAFTGLLGVGGAGFIGRITAGARETTLMAEALGTNAEALFANRQEYEKIGKTATDYKNVLTNLIIAQGEAANGSVRHQEVFAKLGLTMQQVAKMDAATLYDTIKDGSDQGILSATDLNVFLRKESIATFRQVRKGHAELTESQIDGAADVASEWDNAMAEIEKSAIRAVSNSQAEFTQLIQFLEKGATFTIKVVAQAVQGASFLWRDNAAIGRWLLPGQDPDDDFEKQFEEAFGFKYDRPLSDGFIKNPELRSNFVGYGQPPAPEAGGPGSAAYLGPETGFGLPEGDPTNLLAAFVEQVGLQNPGISFGELISSVTSGSLIEPDSVGGGGGGTSVDNTAERLAERSESAFARAFDNAGVRAVREAIEASEFSLARTEAEALHELRSNAASQLETAGEQYLAQQQADNALKDTLDTISDAEQETAKQILGVLEDQLKEQEAIRRNAESDAQRAQRILEERLTGTVEGEQVLTSLQGTETARDTQLLRNYLSYLSGDISAERFGFRNDAAEGDAFRAISALSFAALPGLLGGEFTPLPPDDVGAGGGISQPSVRYGDINININNEGSILAESDIERLVQEAIDARRVVIR